MDLPRWLQVATPIAAVWGAVLSSMALILRYYDRRAQRTRLKVDPTISLVVHEGKDRQLDRVTLKLTNVTVPTRSVHPETVRLVLHRKPFTRRCLELGRLRSYYRSGPHFVPEGGQAEFIVSNATYINALKALPDKGEYWQRFEVLDATGRRHRSHRRKLNVRQFLSEIGAR